MKEIAEYQMRVAGRWIDDALAVKGRPSFEFIAYFSALNALYWLWAVAEQRMAFTKDEQTEVEEALQAVPIGTRANVMQKVRGLQSERKQIEAVAARLGEERAKQFLDDQAAYIQYLTVERGRPIRRMATRTRGNSVGDHHQGQEHLRTLRSPSANTTRKLGALAGALYLVRCNLVHGSKVMDVEDGDLVKRSVPPLRALAKAVLEHTKHCPPE